MTFGPAIAVVGEGSRKEGLEYSAWDMAVGKGGRVHVAMGTNAWKLKLPQEEWGFFYASLDPGAAVFSPVRNINRKPSEGFSLAADDKGNVTACWLSDKLYANVSHDNGETFAPSSKSIRDSTRATAAPRVPPTARTASWPCSIGRRRTTTGTCMSSCGTRPRPDDAETHQPHPVED